MTKPILSAIEKSEGVVTEEMEALVRTAIETTEVILVSPETIN